MTRHIAIIGGGASGILMAAHLLRCHGEADDLRVTLVDAGPNLARGLAYSTTNPSHLLNVRAGQLSAFADEPDHFLHWLVASGQRDATHADFVPRLFFGNYLEHLLAALVSVDGPSRLRVITQACSGLRSLDNGVEVMLADGSAVPAHWVVLATGFGLRQTAGSVLLDPWDGHVPENRDARVLLVGSGLTMVDKVLSLVDAGHRGPITAISRKGFLPRAHGAHHPLQLSTADIPLGSSVHYLCRWLTQLVAAHQAGGGDWRDVMDGLRPHIQTIWKHLPIESRRRFLRHCTAYWDIHRHRMPQAQAQRMDAVLNSGQLTLLRGRFVAAQVQDGQTCVTFSNPASSNAASGLDNVFAADVAYDCRGIRRQAMDAVPPLMASLIESGQAKLDTLGLGLAFDQSCALVNAQGTASPRIYGIGPVTLSALWETIAIPDIRRQAQALSQHLLTKPAGTPPR
ncbi:putative NAD(P)/FAD-binding protein YdhS [Agrobacterium vitis]|nr:putative NAD(P)/FAD-binding protein YdhS [Agrobacterium vitis]